MRESERERDAHSQLMSKRSACASVRAHKHEYVQVFWQTKSRVQPRGPRDEWQQMQQMPPPVVKWAQEGKAQSVMRPGKVDPQGGSSMDYRSLMTKISADDQGR